MPEQAETAVTHGPREQPPAGRLREDGRVCLRTASADRVAAARLIEGAREWDRRGRTLAGESAGRRLGPCWYASARRADSALDEGQLAALREVGYEWDRVSADPQVWRRALPVDPSLGEHPKASQVRPGLAARLVPVARQDGRLPPIQTTSVSQTPPTPLGRAGQALKRLVFGLPLDASAIA